MRAVCPIPAQMWACPGAGCGRVPAQMRACPGADAGESQNRCGRSPGADVGPAIGKAVANPGAVWANSVYPPLKPLHVRVCARMRARACAPALVWLPFYPYLELASLLPLCVCAHVPGGSCVSGSAYVRACVRARATARACNSGDGRGVGRSRTASERGYARWASTPLQVRRVCFGRFNRSRC